MSVFALPVAGARQTWAELRCSSRGTRLTLAAALVLGLFSAALGLVFPTALGYLVDLVDEGSADTGAVVSTTAIMVAATGAGAIGSALTIVLATRAYQTILADLRERLLARSMGLPQGLVERAGTGDLIARASDDVAQVADAAPQVIPALTASGFSILVTLAGLTALDWRYGIAMTVTIPFYLLTVRWYLSTAPHIYRAQRAAMGTRAQHMLESLRGRDAVLGFGLTDRRHNTVMKSSWTVVQHSLRTRTVQNMFFGRLNLAEYIGMGAILATGYLLISSGHSTVGIATTAMLFFLRLFGPINELLFVIDVLQSTITSLGRIVGVITMPEPDHVPSPQERSQPGTVQLRGVSYTYESADRPALDQINLTIEAGQKVAVVGASGAGKTTLAALIAGTHQPDRGTVTRQARTAVITQEVHVFAGTLRDNLTLAAPDATDEDIHTAVAATGAEGLLNLLPDGLDTVVGTGGQELTPAQAQHVALARLMLADPELAILDEATAEADSADAGKLDRAADAVLADRTGLVIAHRLSQAAACDRILVMAAGRIVEDGNHDTLMAAGETYATLWNAWRGVHGGKN
ncbi:ABC transporter ATP-binding protein [Brachybacterium sp. AOP35-5H-19]|uniref:ABC transporter ATP-binding protein n=1 Tax=Brachybacterium sp. AOP35-5H-19 TaxID=3457685 RepID=UPI004034DBA2